MNHCELLYNSKKLNESCFLTSVYLTGTCLLLHYVSVQ